MKKLLSFAMALTLICTMLVACNKKNDNGKTTTDPSASTVEATTWPANDRTKKVPEFKGTISSIAETETDTGKGTTIYYNDVSKKAVEDYIKLLKKDGFEIKEGSEGFYTGKKDKFSATLIYFADNSKFTLMLVEAK